jgi:hypothetical protein
VATGGWGDEQLARASRLSKAYLLYVCASVAMSTALAAVYMVHVASPALLRVLPRSAYSPDADPINETLGWDRVRAAIAAESAHLGPEAVVASEQNVLCGHLDVALGDEPAVYCPSRRRTEFDFIGRRAPPSHAPVIYVDSARYPGDPAVSLPLHSCARVREIAVERGGRVVARYRISECLPLGEAPR